jgi:hypothetical protein
MLVPPDILLDLVLQPVGDLPVNAIHLDSGYKAELFLLREGDAFRSAALGRRQLVDLGPPLGEVFVHSPQPGDPASAAGGQGRHHQPRQRIPDVPGQFRSSVHHEPMSARVPGTAPWCTGHGGITAW